MKLQITNNGFKLWLSANDTYNWATRSGSSWPCSHLKGSRLRVEYDSNGLCDMAVNGKVQDIDGNELNAIVADHVKAKLPETHPSYFVAVGQFGYALKLRN